MKQTIIRATILDGPCYFKVLAKMKKEIASNIFLCWIPWGYIPTVFIKSKKTLFNHSTVANSISFQRANADIVRLEKKKPKTNWGHKGKKNEMMWFVIYSVWHFLFELILWNRERLARKASVAKKHFLLF